MICQIPTKKFTDRLKHHQIEFLTEFDRQQSQFYDLEWHRRGYKTTTVINLLIRECLDHARHRYAYIAPTQVMAREIVWGDPNMLPDALPDIKHIKWKRNEQKMTITFPNGSVLKIAGADEPDSIRGVDYDGGACDEWAMMKYETWTTVVEPIISAPPKPGCRRRWWIFIYTPKGPNHATMQFNKAACVDSEAELPTNGKSKKHRPGWFASRLIADASRIISQEDLDRLLQEVDDGLLPLSFYQQEYQCARVTEEERTLITSAMLDRLRSVNWDSLRITMPKKYRIVAIDPAFGGDMCSIKGFENTRELAEKTLHFAGIEATTNDVVIPAKHMANEIGTKNFIVDCIGNGKGVADELAKDAMGYNVQYFNSSEVDPDDDMHANIKAQAVNYVAGKMKRCEVEPIEDYETRRQLVYLSRYKVNNRGRMQMMKNDDVKKELGCSPDKGLCYIYGIWGQDKVEPDLIGDWQKRHSKGRTKEAMAF